MNILQGTQRLTEIVTTFARFGFSPWIEKIRLQNYLRPSLNQELPLSSRQLKDLPLPQRLRLAFEALGPTFIKFGQILANRQDLLPEAYIESFQQLQDQVTPCPFAEIEAIIKAELGKKFEEVLAIDPFPLGSASIAQVHRAKLHSGEDIVLKVQKPEVAERIREDLYLLKVLGRLLHDHVSDLQSFGLPHLIDEFADSLQGELQFYTEANQIQKFSRLFPREERKNLTDTELLIPKVHWNYCTQKVLALGFIEGHPLSHKEALYGWSEGERTALAEVLLKNYLEQVFVHGFFHGDLHPGNVLLTPTRQWALIDFGTMGRLNARTKWAVMKMLKALAEEDYDQLASEYVFVCPFSDKVVVERFANGLSHTLAPYYGLELNHLDAGQLLLKTARLAAKEGLQVPRELLLFFKSLMGIESVIRSIDKNFDILPTALAFAQSESSQSLSQEEWKKTWQNMAKDSEYFIKELPRLLHFLLKRWNSPQHEWSVTGRGFVELAQAYTKIAWAIFGGLLSLALIIALSALSLFQPQFTSTPLFVFLLLVLVFIVGSTWWRL